MNKPQTQFYTLCVTFNLILLTILGARVFGDENATIQSNLKSRLLPAQDRIRRGENGNPFDEERDTKVLHEKAYLEALELLTAEQKEKWAAIARPVPLSNKAHRNADDGWYRFPVSLQGNWKIENVVNADNRLEPYIGQAVSIDGDSIVLRTDSASNAYHISHVEPGESQIEIDLTAKRAEQSRTFRCLLAVTPHRLTLVRSQNCEHPRPRRLSTPNAPKPYLPLFEMVERLRCNCHCSTKSRKDAWFPTRSPKPP